MKQIISGTYVHTGQLNQDGDIVGELMPLPDLFLALNVQEGAVEHTSEFDYSSVDSEAKRREIVNTKTTKGHLKLFRSDGLGLLQNFNSLDATLPPDAMASIIADQVEVYMPPPYVVAMFYGAKGQSWTQHLCKLIKAQLPSGVKLSVRNLHVGRHLMKPDTSSTGIQSAIYKKWYDCNRDNIIRSIVLPFTRALTVTFSDPVFAGTSVRVLEQNFSSAGDFSSPNSGISTALTDIGGKAIGAASTFLASKSPSEAFSFFHVEITPSRAALDKYPHLKSLKNGKYILKEKVRFSIKNAAGEFEIINGDPISIEESILQQFPNLYSHIIKAATDTGQRASASLEIGTQQSTTDLLMRMVQENQTVIDAGLGLIKATEPGNFLTIIGKAVRQSVDAENVQKTLDLAFNINDLAGSWAGIKKELTTIAGGSGIQSVTWQQIKTHLKNARWLPNVGEEVAQWRRAPLLGKAATLLGAAEFAGSAATLYGQMKGFADTKKDLQQAEKTLESLVAIYAEKVETLVPQEPDVEQAKADRAALEKLAREIKSTSLVEEKDGAWLLAIHFPFDSAAFKPDHSLDALAGFLRKAAKDVTLTLEGHTDHFGSTTYNLALSKRRAEAVKKALLERLGSGFEASRIACVPYGESQPLVPFQPTSSRAAVAQNRRVTALIRLYPKESRFFPSREGLYALEKYRSLSTQKQLSEGEQVLDMLSTSYDLVSGALMLVPGGQLIGGVMQLAKGGATVLASAAEGFRILATNQAHAKAVETFDKTLSQSAANHLLLHQSTSIKDDKGRFIHYQLRLRAEALLGLVRLLMRASLDQALDNWATKLPQSWLYGRTQFDYDANLRYYRIDDYIDRFILNDNWQVTVNSFFPTALDDHWIYLLETGALDKKESKDVLGVMMHMFKAYEKGKLRLLNNAWETAGEAANNLALSVRYISIDADDPEVRESTRAKFKDCFPIHYMASTSVQEFANALKTDFNELTSAIYLYTALHVRSFESAANAWESMEDYLKKQAFVSPLDPVRVIAVLDEQAMKLLPVEDTSAAPSKPRVYPVDLRCVRCDGYNIAGPVKKGFVTRLKAGDLLPAERNHPAIKQRLAENRLWGVVMYPDFQYGALTFAGTQPMATATECLWKLGERGELWLDRNRRWDMHYYYELLIGYNPATLREIRVSGDDATYPSSRLLADMGTALNVEKDWVTQGVEFAIESLETIAKFNPALAPSAHLLDRAPDDAADSADKGLLHTLRLNYRSVFPLAIRQHQRDATGAAKREAIFLDAEFLRAADQLQDYPALFKDPDVQMLVRFDGGPWVFPDDAFAADLATGEQQRRFKRWTPSSLDGEGLFFTSWEAKIEIIFVVASDDIDETAYKDRQIDWSHIPARAKVDYFNDKKSQEFNLTLSYLGDVIRDRNAEELRFHQGQQQIDPRLQPLLELTKHDAHLQWISGLSSSTSGKVRIWKDLLLNGHRKIFAAYLKPNYVAPTGQEVEGLRPFNIGHLYKPDGSSLMADVRIPRPFRFYLTSQGNSGLSEEECSPTLYTRIPFNLCTVLDLSSGQYTYPWARLPEKEHQEALALLQRNREIQSEGSGQALPHPETPAMKWVKASEAERVKIVRAWVEGEQSAKLW